MQVFLNGWIENMGWDIIRYSATRFVGVIQSNFGDTQLPSLFKLVRDGFSMSTVVAACPDIVNMLPDYVGQRGCPVIPTVVLGNLKTLSDKVIQVESLP